MFFRKIVFTSFLIIFGSSIGNTLKAQKYQDVILMKTAKVLRGTITDSVPGETVTIALYDSIFVTVQRPDIHLITKELYRPTRQEVEKKKTERTRQKNDENLYRAVLEAGYGFPIGLEDYRQFKLSVFNGVGLEDTFFMGVSVGLRLIPEVDATIIPITFDLKIIPLKSKYSPVLAFGGGLSLQPNQMWETASPVLRGELGVRIGGGTSSAIILGLGYEEYDVILMSDKFLSFSPTTNRKFSGKLQCATLNFAYMF